LLLAGIIGVSAGEAQDLAGLKAMRKKAAHRQRRIIFNNDGDDIVYECKAPTAEALLRCRTTALLGSQVDSIFYCTWSSGFGMFTHNSKVSEVFTAKTGVFSPNLTGAFIERGLDPLTIMVDFCHKNGIEIFWSMRMNDTHDVDPKYPELFPQFKKDHPEFLVGSKERPCKFGRWTSVNYECPEVRDRAFAFFQDVCTRYEVDGVEMDFFRHPTFFKSVATGGEASQQETDMMTDLVRRVRKLTEEIGAKRGRPILIAVRTPDSVGYCRAIGLDLEKWLKDDLVDILAVSCYFQLNPWEETVRLGHKYGVPVYPSLSESRVSGEGGKLRNSLESYRARAMDVWNSGADGVYIFNQFNPRHPLWRELGDPSSLQKLGKVYFAAVRGFRSTANPGTWLAGGHRFINLPTLAPDVPIPLKPGEQQTIPLAVADDVQWGKGKGVVPQLTLTVQADKLVRTDDLSVALNGKLLSNGILGKQGVEFQTLADQIVRGVNNIEISLKPNAAAANLRDIILWVRYKNTK
ncbi:hypothetical protein FJY63_08420, partial [Candidatus Sumerlaeota bacterium]|nr:hypothetical protein [Candidatus Sumerlaeota bacterium]